MESAPPALQSASGTLIRYVEIWTPNVDNNRLVRVDARLVDNPTGAVNGEMIEVAMGEGLAGITWHKQAVTILQEDPSELLSRISEDCGTRLSALVAIPVLSQQEVRGVIILGLGDGFGAVEVWERDDRDELAVAASHYSGLPKFEFISRYTRFPKGAGIPGGVWNSGCVQIGRDLEQSGSFIRSFGNDPARISAVLGIPIGLSAGFATSVLLFLSAVQAPVARDVQYWDCICTPTAESDTGRVRLERITSFSGDTAIPADSQPEVWQQNVIDGVVTAGGPLMLSRADCSLPSEMELNLAVPVFHKSRLTGILNFLF
jgi:hypothetical protein